ncbi:MAG: head-tail connector protein [Rhodopila sp.]|jgi:uncharacterized phiE125 gp8 family phage protein
MLLQTSLQVTAPPAAEPATIELVRQHCRIDSTVDDDLLASYLTAARIMAEGYLSRALITQTLLWTVRPSSMLRPEQSRLWQPLRMPRAPVQSIVSVSALDDLGNTTTIAPAAFPVSSAYEVSGYYTDLALEPGSLAVGSSTPMIGGLLLHQTRMQYIQVSMIAGFGDTAAAVPLPIVQAILLTVAFLYEHRGDDGGDIPRAAEWLLDRYRVPFLGG